MGDVGGAIGATDELQIALPKPGQVLMGFSTQKGFLSWFIRTATGSPASHSFLLYYSRHFRRYMVLEVQGRGFVQVPWKTWRRHNKLLALYELRRDPIVIGHAMNRLGGRLGDAYDVGSLVGFLLIYVFRLWDRNDLDCRKKLVCSEMVALFLSWTEIPINVGIDRIVPRDLWKLAEDESTFVERYVSKKGKRKLPKVQKRGRELLDPARTGASTAGCETPGIEHVGLQNEA